MAWTVEFSEGTPFLLSLGISKQALALVWIAGPLSGTVGQPVVGILSDNSNWQWGRRRPFIVGGCFVICLSLFLLAHSVQFIGWFLKGKPEDYIKRKTIPFATFGIYLLDFSISAFQAASRAFIVDMLPSHQQQVANAWAARMIGGFNIFGYYLGSIDLTQLTPRWFGETQFKSITTTAIIILLTITIVGCYLIKERNPRTDLLIRNERKKTARKLKDLGLDEKDTGIKNLIISLYRQTAYSISRLSPQVKIVNLTEFLAWIGYFPMLFYTTTYVGELYIYEVVQQRYEIGGPDLPPLTAAEKQKLLEDSTRRGSTALLVHSISSLLINIILPRFVEKKQRTNVAQRLYTDPDPLSNNDDSQYDNNGGSSDSSSHIRVIPNSKFKFWLSKLSTSPTKLSVQRSWTISHGIFVLCMISTFWITTSTQAIVMFAVLGIPWGSALWAPFVLIAEEITRIKEKKSISASGAASMTTTAAAAAATAATARQQQHPVAGANAGSVTNFDIGDNSSANGNGRAEESIKHVHANANAKYNNYEHESGIILGIHNVFVSAPQVISSLFSSVLFKLLSARFKPDDKFEGMFDDSLGWVFRFGGVMAIGAMVMSLRVKSNEELELEDEVGENEEWP